MSRSARVLDVAAGTGASLVPAAERRPRRQRGRRRYRAWHGRASESGDQANRLDNAKALVADAEQLPFQNGSFDTVVCGFGLFFFPDPLRALREFLRVTRSDGIVALSTFTRDGSGHVCDLAADR